ncbi:MAG: hypothetical protein RQ743_02645 [Bacteroidales bacterium]|nr:hypothetical protein [Bacteroidales bacterium]
MIINRQNYQIWITDYYDGQLDDFQVEVLMDFLSDKPDLLSEFEEYHGCFLNPDDEGKLDKSELLRSPEQLTNEQVEHFSIALCENDLDEKQKLEINELKKSDPRFRKNISLYEKIRLEPGNTAYPDKSLLLKIPGKRRITRIIISSLSIAASIAILTGLFLILDQQQAGGTDESSLAAFSLENESEQKSREKAPRLDLPDETIRYIPARTETQLAVTTRKPDIIRDEKTSVQKEAWASLRHLTALGEINLYNKQVHYLPAEIKPYEISLPAESSETLNMSVREFLAYHFRKEILDKEDPGIEHLKAWEIADAGIKGVNTLLGWNMELRTGESEEGRLENICFTSELIKFEHKSSKNKAGL